MFITKLTKRDWFRIFKYLWNNNCVYKLNIYSIKAYLFSLDIFTIYFLYLFLRNGSTSDLISSAVIVGIRLIFPSILFWRLTLNRLPQILITFEKIPEIKILRKIKQQYPSAFINRFGIFSPPLDNKWDLLIFEDYYLLYTKYRETSNGRSKKFQVFVPLKKTDIVNKNEFLKCLEPICQRKIDLSNTKLHC
ncbi:hypothetical protein [Ligilactobacillus faecis]|uniref:hypothetical protein n=1 Tax=Ligilactobacillus faecis TaxID=762833 RepID=UPI002469A446|nr:hypothetical protein [Ligilactobacillus faecis]WGN90144.1 hypothetical protein QFX10_03525 [Ligilactobacillus faecis]